MSWRTRVCLSSAVVCVVLTAVAPASAVARVRLRPISGTLSASGYTVIALAADGQATSARTRGGRFSLRPPAERVTLQLRAPDGVYAGPVVVGRAQRGRRAIVGVRAGARLGRIRVDVRRGYAKPRRRPPVAWTGKSRWARARNGVPIGAGGSFGRVRSRRLPRTSTPGDRDVDGIPDVLDVDDDGDLILDKLDRSTAAHASQAGNQFSLFTVLPAAIYQTVNVDAGSTDQQIDAYLPEAGMLLMSVLPGDSAELDCGGANQRPVRSAGLVYCSPGGTGKLFQPGVPNALLQPFPACCDADHDGFGTLVATNPANPSNGSLLPGMFLRHGATSSQIKTGDVLIQRVTTGGVETGFPAELQYVFATVPALVSYSDGRGNAATVHYPVPGPPAPGAGTDSDPFPVAAGPNGDVVVTVVLWRPQRTSIGAEPGRWTDIGGLNYTASIADRGQFCPQSAFSEPGPSLAPPSAPINRPDAGGFTDLTLDRPADPANTVSFKLDLTRCLAAHGLSFDVGETRDFGFSGIPPNAVDEASQSVAFRRVGP
jgi:hypothetical protein